MADDYRLETDYAVGMLRVSGGVVISAAPIFRRFFGRLFSNVQAWAEAHGYKLIKLPPEQS